MAFWNTKKPQTPPEPDIRTYEAEPPHYVRTGGAPAPLPLRPVHDGVYRKPALRQDKALISCVGDMLAEEKLYKSHLIGGRTDFHDVFTFVRPYFARLRPHRRQSGDHALRRRALHRRAV